MKEYKKLLLLYLSGLFALGLGYIAVLPPFEGFDENSHYSNIRKIAATGKLPAYGSTMLDALVVTYAQTAPMPYGTLRPPFDRNMAYYKFFLNPDTINQYIHNYRQAPVARNYEASTDVSWEALHAPLYYLLLAPVEKITDGLSLVSQVLILRLISFAMVIAGVALSLRTAGEEAFRGFVLYPLLFPMFFAEFGRIGNDSLCMFLSAILALLLSFYSKSSDRESIVIPAQAGILAKTPAFAGVTSRTLSLLIGLVLGAGLLTKAFFIPISAGIAVWMAAAYLWKAEDAHSRKRHVINMLIIGFTALAIGAPWYIGNLINDIPIVGFGEPQMLAQQGGLIAGLEKNFTLHELMEGFAVNLVTWIWEGTWSLVHILPLMYVPMLMLLFLVLGAFAFTLKGRPLKDPAWLGVALFCFFEFGFLRHIIISLAISGTGNTPSAYLHILLPWVAPILGIGIATLARHRLGSMALKLLVSYAVLFQLSILWSQLALFAGCATKGDDKYYHFPDQRLCLNALDTVMENLGTLAWPHLALACFAGGIICFYIVFRNMRKLHEQKN